jgi:hypothetical protein
MAQVILKVKNAGMYGEIIQSKLPISKLENGTIVVRSPLGESAALNEDPVWLRGMVTHERRVLKSAVAAELRMPYSKGKTPAIAQRCRNAAPSWRRVSAEGEVMPMLPMPPIN